MRKNSYPGKFTPHLSTHKSWFASLEGSPILPQKKGAGFIVFEGLDGSGQSTQAGLLRNFLVKKGYQVVLTKEPTSDSAAGRIIRKVLDKKKKISPKKLQELYAEDRKEHLKKVIIPALKKGKIVISDRYCFSSFAYGSLEVPLNYLLKINEKFLLPDLVFLIDTKPATCVLRIKKRGKKETLFERKDKLEKVYRNYKKIIKKFKTVIPINGEKRISRIHQEIRKYV